MSLLVSPVGLTSSRATNSLPASPGLGGDGEERRNVRCSVLKETLQGIPSSLFFVSLALGKLEVRSICDRL